MDTTVFLFLSGGLFLGWTLGANDAANVFGTAVGTRMLPFIKAAVICGLFVILGAAIGGGGTTGTIGRLGAVNALAGAFMTAFAAGITVYGMTRAGLPVSVTEAIVGAIIGWNLFSGMETDTRTLIKILSSWIMSPIMAAIFAMILFELVTAWLRAAKLHLLHIDAYTRLGLILAGAFGAYSLGANNIANVVGVFIPAMTLDEISLGALGRLSSAQQLFILGGIAIATGVVTYSKRVMMTIGSSLASLSPIAAWVVVVSYSLVLFIFSSQGLERFLAANGLPTIPLVPVSSSQAVVGAIIGIGIVKDIRGIRWRTLGHIGLGWVLTPPLAGLVSFIGLFFLQNVFGLTVHN